MGDTGWLFIIATTVTLGVGITDGNILFYHGVSEGSLDKKIPTRDYNNRTIYDCFNNPFPYDCGMPDFSLPLITIDDISARIKEPTIPRI